MNLKQRKKIIEKMLDSLKEKAVLNNNPGRFLRQKYVRPTTKKRRHSGRRYPRAFYPNKLLEQNGVFLDEYWDDWIDYRDGFRDKSRWKSYPCCYYWDEHIEEFLLLRRKLNKHKQIRKARKEKQRLKS